MFEKDAIQARGKALEDEYFHRVDEVMLNRIRADLHRKEAEELLSGTLGFEDDLLVEHLVDAGINAGTVSALVLVPLVFVAWADNEISSAERQAIMSDAIQRGLRSNKDSLQLIEHWLEKRPTQQLWKLWCEYSDSLRKSLPHNLERILSGAILSRCEAVAQAEIGLFGAKRISKPASEMLDRIKAALGFE